MRAELLFLHSTNLTIFIEDLVLHDSMSKIQKVESCESCQHVWEVLVEEPLPLLEDSVPTLHKVCGDTADFIDLCNYLVRYENVFLS